jgi:DNA-binding Xre family transcriptional regulator
MNIKKSVLIALADAGMKHQDLADKMKISPQSLSRMIAQEGGRIENLEIIAKKFGMKTSHFVALGEN